MELKARVVLISGASSGVGRAAASMFAQRGARVMINYRKSKQSAEAVVAEIRDAGGEAFCMAGDVADDQACRQLVEATEDRWGSIDVLVNNAGTTEFIPFSDLEAATDEVWERILRVNLLGPFHLIRAAESSLKEGGGEIVNVSSVAGLAALGSSVPYACSKAALNTLTVAMARTLAPHVRVNAVAPGFIAGRWLEEGLGDHYQAVKERYEQSVPLQAVCQPEDVARAIVSLVEGSDLVTGQVVACDSGLMMIDPLGLRR